TAEDDAIAVQATGEAAAAATRLPRRHVIATKPFRPIRDQHRMGGTSDRVLVDAGAGGEDAADDVGVAPGRGDDGEDVAFFLQLPEVGPERKHLRLGTD